jgi:two-component system KDP operon response regulator KdpE
MKVLAAEDNPVFQSMLRALLTKWGYDVVAARDGIEAWRILESAAAPRLAILDWMMPGVDGVELCRRVRAAGREPYIYILLLTARTESEDLVQGMEAGADDYLTKPFALGELLARLRVALRHAARAAGAPEEPVFELGELKVDLAHRRVFLAGAEVHLTPTEYKLLTTLVRHAGKVLTHRQLLKDVWGAHAAEQTANLRVYMTQLRHKLERAPAKPRYLLTEAGVGYRLKTD